MVTSEIVREGVAPGGRSGWRIPAGAVPARRSAGEGEMSRSSLVVLEQDHARFMTILDRVRDEANAKLVFLLDKNGQQIAGSGDIDGVDATALASLAAGNVAATEGLAQLIGETEFSSLFHEGQRDNLHITLIVNKIILLVIFDEKSSLGLVRLRVNQHSDELGRAVRIVLERDLGGGTRESLVSAPLGEITDEDLDALFG